MIPKEQGLRERKKSETRRRIRTAALDLALEHGLDNVTVEMITDVAGVSRRTFFNYFNAKEDALVTDMTGIVEKIDTMLEQRPGGEPPMRSLRNMFAANDPFHLIGLDPGKSRARQDLTRQHQALLTRQMVMDARNVQALGEVFARHAGREAASMTDLMCANLTAVTFRVAVGQWVGNDKPRRKLSDLVAEAFDVAYEIFGETEEELDD